MQKPVEQRLARKIAARQKIREANRERQTGYSRHRCNPQAQLDCGPIFRGNGSGSNARYFPENILRSGARKAAISSASHVASAAQRNRLVPLPRLFADQFVHELQLFVGRRRYDERIEIMMPHAARNAVHGNR